MNCLDQILIELVASDPWDWVIAIGDVPLSARILRWQLGAGGLPVQCLLSLESPSNYGGVQCKYFIGSPRHEGDNLDAIIVGGEVLCALTHIPDERANASDPFDLTWWRGGVGLICTVRRKNK